MPSRSASAITTIKFNHGFKCFRRKGNMKVSIEFGLVALAHNLRKYARHLSEKSWEVPPKAVAIP